MAKGIKGITVEIGGNTAPLQKALQGVNQTAKDLQSELNQVNKALKLAPNNLTLVSQKQQILKEEIGATKEKLDALKAAQAQVTAQFKSGAINAEQYRAFQRELLITKSRLEDLKDQKKNVSVIGSAFTEVKSKVQDVLDKLSPVAAGLEKVGKAAAGLAVGGVKVVGSAVDAAGKSFAAYTGAAAAAGTAVIGMTSKAAGAADEINTIAKQTGLSTAEIQKFQYAADVIDVPLETLTGSMAKLTRNMASAQESGGSVAGTFRQIAPDAKAVEIATLKVSAAQQRLTELQNSGKASASQLTNAQAALLNAQNNLSKINAGSTVETVGKEAAGAAKAFEALGIKITDSNGNLRNNQDVFSEAIAALEKMENETERDALAMQLFGKSAQDLNPLILDGADALKTLGDQAEKSGLILSQDALDHLNSFQDGIDVLKSSSSAAGNVLAGTFAGGLTQTLDVVNKSIPEITGSLSKLFSGGDISTAQSDLTDTFASGMGEIVSTVSRDLPKFISGFNAVIISIITAITTVLPSLINTVLPVLIQGFTDLISAIIPLIPVLLPIILDAGFQIFMGLINGLNLIVPDLIAMLPELINKISTMLISNLPLIITAGMQLIISLILGIANSIPQLITAVIALIPVIVKGITDNLPALITAGIELIVALAKGLPQAIPAVIMALPEIINAIINGLFEQDWLQIGIDILTGIANGLVEGVKAIGKTIRSVASNLVDQFKSFLGIASPSKLFADVVGKNLALGIGEGFMDSIDAVGKSMSEAVPSQFATSLSVDRSAANSASFPDLGLINSAIQSGLSTAMTASRSPVADTPITINLYLEGMFERSINVIKRKNQRAGKIIIPVGG